MIDRVLQQIRKFGMLPEGSRVGVAVSGGADSVCLLHVLKELEIVLRVRVCVLHLNHMLRGIESDQDADFVARLAASLSLPVILESEDLREVADNLEQAGRHARYRFFAKVRSSGIADRIATAHTRSDQAETVLYRLLRGSGTAGLSGILPVTGEGIVRPLLTTSRKDVEEFLRSRDLSWREDATNSEPRFVRNRIRHRVLPVLREEVSPAIDDILSATSEISRQEEDYWNFEIGRLSEKILKFSLGTVLLRADELVRLHPAVARRLLRRAVVHAKGDMRSIDLLHIERVMQLAASSEGHGRTQIPGLDVFRSFEWLRIGPPRAESRAERDYATQPVLTGVGDTVQIALPDRGAIFLEIRDLSRDYDGAYNEGGDELDWERLPGPLELRNWHPGDEFEPVGRSKQKIKSLFQESRVPIWDRQSWPVLTSGDEIVWTRSFGVSDKFRPGMGTALVLRVYEIEKFIGNRHSADIADAETDESKRPA